VVPANLLLHDNEGKLVFKNEKNTSKLYIYDLETGKLQQTIKTGRDVINFNSLCNDSKSAQKDAARTFYGVET
jgi:hypothetical protein